MSYQLVVEFGRSVPPSADDIRKVVREFYKDLVSSDSGVLQISDPLTRDSFSVDLKDSPSILRLEVPFSGTFRSVSAAYGLAWAISDRFGGTVRDPQLGGPPSIDLAKIEWRKRETTPGLATIFGGAVPADLKTRIRQRRGLIRQDIEIRGGELEIRRKQGARAVNYSVPILSLRNVQENTVPNPVGVFPIMVGLFILIMAAVVGPPVGGQLFVVSIFVIPLSFVVFYRWRRRILLFPGQGGNLLLEAASPSKPEVEQFLASIDRVRFAITRSQIRKPVGPKDTDDESMRIT